MYTTIPACLKVSCWIKCKSLIRLTTRILPIQTYLFINVFKYMYVSATSKSILIEPHRGKTNNVVSEQARLKPACTVTEDG